ncbi:stage II sporulation protein M [Adhaeribacter pallidiroseus]|uniref:Stage II sporulation protein M n=1 Tax=Adhaeribacter pallidiroseus TaxID=2072847 RepID=A0A369QHR5_9BACT|nr:stage II sporulation protein M [Adhaeribacter pallidiroseus]RDC64264.1 hypothetical protein AHMF7616_02877 [Adhaeribacter pallidiroseus]
MREAAFIKQNAAKWKLFENQDFRDPDLLADRFIQLTDDLSYARTFYPNSDNTAYLNALAAKVHQAIYKNNRTPGNRFVQFWHYELPLLFRQYQKQLLFAFIIFSAGAAIGVLSAAFDDTFVRLILGDGYVNQTIANIQKGDPMAIYKQDGQTEMFLEITLNNIRVSFFAFIYGVFLSVGTFWILLRNGIMLGAFQYFFYKQGLLLPSVLTVWIHGTLEISAIVIAGCAGFILGNSILFPKTYSRLDSFKIAARQGLKITVGLVPVFIVAGFLESFVTRHTEMPMALSLFIILTSLFFILFILSITRRHFTPKIRMTSNLLNFREERDLSQKINATFGFIKQHFKPLFRLLLFIVLPLALVGGLFLGIYQRRALTLNRGERDIEYGTYAEYEFYKQISSFNYLIGVFCAYVSFLLLSLVLYSYILEYMDNQGQVLPGTVWYRVKQNFMRVFFSSFGIFLLWALGSVLLIVPGIYLAVALSFYLMVMLREDLGFVETVERCLYLIKGNWWSTLGMLLIISLIQALMALVLGFPVWVLQIMQVLDLPGADNDFLMISANTLSSVLSIFMYVIIIVALAFQYFHLVEIKDGIGLLEQAELIGSRHTPVADEEDF